MPSLRKVLRYIGHYGIFDALGLIREKLIVDKRRFNSRKKRVLPEMKAMESKAQKRFTEEYAKQKKTLCVMYLIHYFYPKKKGGTERFVLNLATEMKRMGNRPIVVLLDANEPMSIYTERVSDDIFYRVYEYSGIECVAFRHKRAPSGLYYKDVRLDDCAMMRFAEFITEKYSVDTVHAAYPQPFASFLIFCKQKGIPYIVTCTDFCMMCHYSTLIDGMGDFCIGSLSGEKCRRNCKTYGCRDFGRRFRNAEQILAAAEAVTVPSDFVAGIFESEFPSVDFITVAHGISGDFRFTARKGIVRKFVYAGTLSMLKGVHLLIEAFASVNRNDITLDVFGEGDARYVASLKAMKAQRVNFRGAVSPSEMPRIFSEADCVIIPSMWYETYNFVVREAISTGAVVIASRIGAIPEAVEEGENGFLFEPGDKASLREAIEKAADFDLSRYRRRRFQKPEDEARIYLAIYSGAMSKNGEA